MRAGLIRQPGRHLFVPASGAALDPENQREHPPGDERVGGQEFYLPALNPAEIWKESGRWTVMGDNMFRLKDRKGADLCLGMTHEEIFTDIARNELRSYKQLPQVWYQIQSKFRDEPRPNRGCCACGSSR